MSVLRVHELKVQPEYVIPMRAGLKRADLRPDDRDFRVGDHIHYTAFEPRKPDSKFDGGEYVARISHILDRTDTFGRKALRPGWVMLSIDQVYGSTADAIIERTAVKVVQPRRAQKAKRK